MCINTEVYVRISMDVLFGNVCTSDKYLCYVYYMFCVVLVSYAHIFKSLRCEPISECMKCMC